jgi:D-xylose transport system substrate-binding protein
LSILRRSVVLAASVALVAGAAACEKSSNSSSSSNGGSGKKIALLLPESQTTRYESFDKPIFEAKVKALCSDCTVVYQNASQDENKQKQQMDGVLAQGVNVVVLDPVNGESAGTLATTAKAKKVPVVAYDRLIKNTDLDAYVSFDNEEVGRAQAQSLLDKLKADGKTSGKIVMINGSTTDNNALLFNKGAHSVFDKQTAFQLTPSKDFFTPEWKPENAQTFMAGQIATLGKTGFVGVYSANDGMAGGAIAAMRSAGIKPIPPVTGQDSELAAIQRILTGDQYMTIYKSYKAEAEKTAEVAVALAQGKTPAGLDAKVNNGQKDVPSALLPVVAATKDKIASTIVADKLWTVQQICTAEFATACKSAGLQ